MRLSSSFNVCRRHLLLITFLAIQVQVQKPFAAAKNIHGSLEQELPPTIGEVDQGRSWRLPNTTYPLKYHLHITTWVHREIFKFSGNVTIELLVKENTSELVLHAVDLQIQQITVEDLVSQQKFENLTSRIWNDLLVIGQSDSNVEDDSNLIENSRATVFTRNQRLRLEIIYAGVINQQNKGFHILTYEDDNNHTVYGAFTQMEPTYARKVLPCYDEPGYKAHFNVRITHGSNYTAISNMPAIATSAIEDGVDDMTTTSFMETPPMCTYLLAWVISNYEFISVESDGILQRVFLPPNYGERGEDALKNAIAAVSTFARYLDIPYSLAKLDHVLVRESYGSAMENWGLIIYSDAEFILQNETDYQKRFRRINTQNHEVVHQWFGNLVSPAWWDSLWLNEGMASYYSHKLTDMMYPEDKRLQHFAISNCNPKTYEDLTPVSQYLEKPVDIIKKFGTVMYQKAPCIVRMFDNAFGEQNFHMAVKNFLKAYAYSIANEEQFFDHLQSVLLNSTNGEWAYNVHEIMKSWFHTRSIPTVHISLDTNDSSIIHITQEAASISDVPGETELWWVPLNFATPTQPNFENTQAIYYMPPTPKLTLNLNELNITLGRDDWLLANIKDTGLYNVIYDGKNLIRIAKTLQTNHNAINSLNRAQILRSISHMFTDELTLVPVLEVLKYLQQEEDSLVWNFVIVILTEIEKRLSCSASLELFRDFIRYTVAPQYNKYAAKPEQELSWHEESMLDDLSEIACYFDLRECIERSKIKFIQHKANIFEGDYKYERLVEICNAAKIFNDTEFEETLQFLLAMPENWKLNYWHYLRCTHSTEQYEKLLEVWLVTKKSELKDNLYFITNEIEAEDGKWNSKYTYLKKEILQLENDLLIDLCGDLEFKADEICKSYHTQYLELMELCAQQLSKHDIVSKKPKAIKLGGNFDFANRPEWQLEEQKVYQWLEQENEIYHNKNFK